MKNNRKHFVTHVIVPELPEQGYDQVFFYTATEESYNQGKYYWGAGNNSFDQNFINELLKGGKIIRLTECPMLLADSQTIWVDSLGELYLADLHEPTRHQKKLNQQVINIIDRVYRNSVGELKDWPPAISKVTTIPVTQTAE